MSTVRHPTDTVRLAPHTRSDEAVEVLSETADWLAEIDQVLDAQRESLPQAS